MEITLSFRGPLTEYLPPGSGRRSGSLEIADGATIGAVLARLRVPMELVHLVLLNGVNVHPRDLDSTTLRPQDSLAVWPPLSGG
ncbi:MAG: MoaD/ThiS family protein [Myxococcota bacterium]|nr:MoaD/ThiS family protein [Myxococcota bacterium]